ncbi:hypothetical protein FUAX_06120 [Fulvitalea axinellae]|uniref:Uncharacterized protein n=1 Tax=Fulvitalea axinellae TaxID=1182444 RepID=A0AAU9CG54_9BACT|nr:hypothetical protein FUAX_06120 [Fulvitalea axinellae]
MRIRVLVLAGMFAIGVLASCNSGKKKAERDDVAISIGQNKDIKYLADATVDIETNTVAVPFTGGALAKYKVDRGNGWQNEWMLFLRRVDRSLMLLPPVTDEDRTRPNHNFQPRIAYLVSDGETIKQAMQTYLSEKYQERDNFLVDLKADIFIEGDSSWGQMTMVSIKHPRDTGVFKFRNMKVVDLGKVYFTD